MTLNEKDRFKAAFNRLAVATRLHADEIDPAMQVIYFDGLQDIPIEAIELSADDLGREVQWFPKLAEWRQRALREKFALFARALPAVDAASVWCEVCQDTGWERAECSAGARCGRPRCVNADANYTHTYAKACDCRPTNAAYQHDRIASFGGHTRELSKDDAKSLLAEAHRIGESRETSP